MLTLEKLIDNVKREKPFSICILADRVRIVEEKKQIKFGSDNEGGKILNQDKDFIMIETPSGIRTSEKILIGNEEVAKQSIFSFSGDVASMKLTAEEVRKLHRLVAPLNDDIVKGFDVVKIDEMGFTMTNGRFLYKERFSINIRPEKEMIELPKDVIEWLFLFIDEFDEITISQEREALNKIFFEYRTSITFGATLIVSKFVKTKYPNIDTFYPVEDNMVLLYDKEELMIKIQDLKKVAEAIYDAEERDFKLILAPDKIKLFDPIMLWELSTEYNPIFEPKAIPIKVNYNDLFNLLTLIEGSNVEVRYGKGLNAKVNEFHIISSKTGEQDATK